MKKEVLKEILSTSLYLLFVLCLTYMVIHFVGQRTVVNGSSMEATLSDQDNLIVDKISYRFHEPERFDIVVFPYQYKEDTYLIKRIIGLPGETIYIDANSVIYINGEPLAENYGKEVLLDPGRAYQEIQLGNDEYFVMGDNRNNSADSRDPAIGNLHRSNIIGKAWIRIWPLGRFGKVQ